MKSTMTPCAERPSALSIVVCALALGIAVGTTTGRALAQETYPHEDESIGTVREIYDGTLSPEMAVNTFRNIHRLFPSATIPASTDPLPLPVASDPLADSGRLRTSRSVTASQAEVP